MRENVFIAVMVLFSFALVGCEPTAAPSTDELSTNPSQTEVAAAEEEKELEEIAYTWWQDKLYRSPETGDLLYANMRDNKIVFRSYDTSFTVISDAPEYSEDNNGKFIRYVYELNLAGSSQEFNQIMSVIYYPALDMVVIFGVGNGGNFGDYYEYYQDRIPSSSSTEIPDWGVQPENEEPTPDFYDDARYECFKTLSGDDMVLTVRIFSDETTGDYFYKGELSNGVEFWFYEISQDGGEYEIEYIAGECSGKLTHMESSSDLTLHTEGYDYLSDYDGTYIQIPDKTQVESEEAGSKE